MHLSKRTPAFREDLCDLCGQCLHLCPVLQLPLEEAKEEFNLNLEESFVIGDHPHDVNLGKNAGCKTIYLLTGHGKEHKDEITKEPDFTANSLLEAAQWILK